MKLLLSLLFAVISFSAFSSEYSSPGFEGRRTHSTNKGFQIHKKGHIEYLVGQVGFNCTGTLIGPRHVLTSASCVYNLETKTWNDRIGFYPGKLSKLQDFQNTTMWKRVFILKEFMNKKPNDPEKFKYDFAVIELDWDMGEEAGWVGFRAADPNIKQSTKISVTGYPLEKEPGSMWTINCPVHSISAEIFYQCQSYGGMPGAGLMVQEQEDNLPFIIGVHSAGIDSDNIGAAITQTNFKHILSWVKDANHSANTVIHKRTDPKFVNVIIRNSCSQKIQVAVKWHEYPTGKLKKNGFYLLNPGQESHLFDTAHDRFFIWAQSWDGKLTWEGSYNEYINNNLVKMEVEEISSKYWGYWIYEFNCPSQR